MKPVKVDPKIVATPICRELLRSRLAQGGIGGCPVCLAGRGVSVINRYEAEGHLAAHYYSDDYEDATVWFANGIMHGLYVFPADEWDMGVAAVDAQRGFMDWLWLWLHKNIERIDTAGFTCFVRSEACSNESTPRLIGYVDAGLYEVLRDASHSLGRKTDEWRAFANALLAEVAATSPSAEGS